MQVHVVGLRAGPAGKLHVGQNERQDTQEAARLCFLQEVTRSKVVSQSRTGSLKGTGGSGAKATTKSCDRQQEAVTP